jgi:hypothetical protein
MSRPIIAVTDSPFPSLDPAMAALKRLDPEVRMSKSAAAEDILAVARDADAILVTYAKLAADLIGQLTRCRAIGRFGLGVDNIDLVAAKQKGIAVNYVPDYCIREVSDHAMALLLALIRKIPLSNTVVQAGRWEMPAVVLAAVYPQRTLLEYTDFCQAIAARWPEAQTLRLVQDNLNTHATAAFYRHLPADQAFELAQKFEFYYTPKSASWLNMIEIEFSAIARQCLNRRIPTVEMLRSEVLALVQKRDAQRIQIDWQFSVSDARQKMRSHYQHVNPANQQQ